MKILIVDDSRAMRKMVLHAIQNIDLGECEIFEAGNGREGLDQVKEYRPDIVLSDWKMPEMNGLEFLVALREKGNNICFGFVTMDCTDSFRENARLAGADFFVTKPFSPEKIELEIRNRLLK